MDAIIRPERDQAHAREPANSSNERPGRSYEGHTAEEALAIARDARAAFERWRPTSFADRARLVKAAAGVLRKRRDEFAELMTAEMGKTVTEGRAEIEKCAFNCDYFAEQSF